VANGDPEFFVVCTHLTYLYSGGVAQLMSSTDATTDCPGLPSAVTDEILSSRRRCRVVTALATVGGEAIVEDLAVAVLAAEQGVDPGEIDTGHRKEVERDLYDRHLPKLTATGLLEYDSMLGRVRLTEPVLAKLARGALSD
jgi:hypothetical protein